MNDPIARIEFNETVGMTTSEAYVVKSETLFFFALVYQDQEKYYHGKGCVLFSNGEHIGFSTTADRHSVVLNRCNQMAEQLADQSDGTLEKGIIDDQGVFQNQWNK